MEAALTALDSKDQEHTPAERRLESLKAALVVCVVDDKVWCRTQTT